MRYVVGTECRFVGHDGRIYVVGDEFQSFYVIGCHRLFNQFYIGAGIFHAVDGAYGLFWFPALIGIETDGDIWSGSLADGTDTLDIEGGVNADFEFQVRITGFDSLLRILYHLVR